MMYMQKTLVTRVSEVAGRFCTRTDITALKSGVASRLVARVTGTSGHNRRTPRGYRLPCTSPLSPVVRHAGGGHNTYIQGRVTFWTCQRETENCGDDARGGAGG